MRRSRSRLLRAYPGISKGERRARTLALREQWLAADPAYRDTLLWEMVLVNDAMVYWFSNHYGHYGTDDDVQDGYLAVFYALKNWDLTKASWPWRLASFYYRNMPRPFLAGVHLPRFLWERLHYVLDLERKAAVRGKRLHLSEMAAAVQMEEYPLLAALWAYGAKVEIPLDTWFGEEKQDSEESADTTASRWLQKALETLTDRERALVELYFEEDATLSNVGAAAGISRERVRQILKDVLQRLRDQAERESEPLPAEVPIALLYRIRTTYEECIQANKTLIEANEAKRAYGTRETLDALYAARDAYAEVRDRLASLLLLKKRFDSTGEE